ncbi:MAG TPA: DHHA1 domain-containing protein [Vicinamibacterales bacterium]|nr:DHHA1 domain-containing protein [Vicinamibacterales bacterium]
MTTRLYYTEPQRQRFEASVVSCQPQDDRFAAMLDCTAFYPTSGGQPHDTGRLGDATVLDVVEGDDGTVVHVVDRPLVAGAVVDGAIDWPRRFDHMQQHTGQHLLSAAFDHLHRARTVSFHLGAESSTIDLAREVSVNEIARAEAEANRIVWENRPVTIRFVDEAQAASLPLRKEPARSGELRLIEVSDFDLSACGGTHVAATGAIGMIAVAGWERFKGGTRLTFVCGGRALRSHGRLRDVVAASTRLLSVSADDLPGTLERLQAEQRERTRENRRLREDLAVHQAAEVRAEATAMGPLRVVLRHEPGADGAVLKTLASAVVSEPGMVAVFVGDGQPAPVVVARADDVTIDAGRVVKALVAQFGGRGGGRPELAQGGIAADAQSVLAGARAHLQAQQT